MIPNSNNLICGQNFEHMKPLSELLRIQTIPFCFRRTSASSFLYCNTKENMTTNLIEASLNNEQKISNKSIEEFMGAYQYSSFSQENALLLNTEGDVLLYNLYSKQSYFIEKQHPSCFSPIQIHNIESFFITCGGNVKTSLTTNEKIIKLWQQKEGELVNPSRIVTGHEKPIQNSFLLARNKVVTLSTDKTLRLVNLATEEIASVMHVNSGYYSGCSLDWHSALLGGTSKTIDVYDSRAPKIVLGQQINNPSIIQLCEITRISANNYLLANVNEILILDIRKMKLKKWGAYDGERISKFMALDKQSLLIGNRDKTMQVWKFY